jgi:hypothetical protein
LTSAQLAGKANISKEPMPFKRNGTRYDSPQ